MVPKFPAGLGKPASVLPTDTEATAPVALAAAEAEAPRLSESEAVMLGVAFVTLLVFDTS